MPDAAELEGYVRLIVQIRIIAQQQRLSQCFGILGKDVLQLLADGVVQPQKCMDNCMFRSHANFGSTSGIADEEDAVTCVVSRVPHAVGSGIAEVKIPFDHIAGTDLLHPIDVDPDLPGFALQGKLTVYTHTVVRIIAVGYGSHRDVPCCAVHGLCRDQVQLHKAKIPDQADGAAKERHGDVSGTEFTTHQSQHRTQRHSKENTVDRKHPHTQAAGCGKSDSKPHQFSHGSSLKQSAAADNSAAAVMIFRAYLQ